MTKEELEKEGFKAVFCTGHHRCSPLPHDHFKLCEDVEYCPVERCILVDTVGFAGVPASRLPLEVAVDCAKALFSVTEAVTPFFPLKAIYFV